MNAILAAIVILVSFAYLSTINDAVLLAIPLLSLLWWKLKGKDVAMFLSLFFGFYLLLSSICLFAGFAQSMVFGILAYVYFASAALVSFLQYLVEEDDS